MTNPSVPPDPADEIAPPAPPRRLPPAIPALLVIGFALTVVLLAVALTRPEQFPAVVVAILITAGLAALFGVAAARRRGSGRLPRFLRRGFRTEHETLSARAAAVQILILPALFVCWAVLVGLIWIAMT